MYNMSAPAESPPRESADSDTTRKVSAISGADAVSDHIADVSDKLTEAKAALEALAHTAAVASDDFAAYGDWPGEARPVPVVEVASAAGAGSAADMETVTGRVWFRRSWLDDHGMDPTRCVVIGVKGDSMHPTLVDGCSILMDRARVRRRAGHIYVIRTGDGLLAKRLGKDEAGGWVLKSDNQVEPARAWSDDMEVVGEVRWTARSLPGA